MGPKLILIMVAITSVVSLPRPPSSVRNGIIGEQYHWPMGVVPFTVDATFTSLELLTIDDALSQLEELSCILFVPKEVDSINWIDIKKNDGETCKSVIGKQEAEGGQDLILGSDCLTKGMVMHEMLHELGCYHEQSRTDRDDYVIVNMTNISPENHYLFEKLGEDKIDDFGVAYDYGSIMHSANFAFALDPRLETVTPLQDVDIGQREGLSPSDIIKLNAMYKCTTTSPTGM